MGPWWAWAAMALSAAAKAKGAHDVEKKQNQLAEAMRQYGLVKSGEQDAATRGYIDTITPEARAQQLAQAQGDVRSSIEQTVAEALKAQPLNDMGGKVSEDYQRVRSAGTQSTAEKIKRAIEQLSVGASTDKLATADNYRQQRTAGDLLAASIASRNVGDQYVNAIQTVRPSSGLNLLGDVAGMVGSMGFAGAGSAGAASSLASAIPSFGTGRAGLGLRVPTGPATGLRL